MWQRAELDCPTCLEMPNFVGTRRICFFVHFLLPEVGHNVGRAFASVVALLIDRHLPREQGAEGCVPTFDY